MAVMSLIEWMEANGVTQMQFAERTGISQRTISHIKHGGNTDFENLRKIHEVTDGAVTPNMIILGVPG